MPSSTYMLEVRRPEPLLSALIDVFCGDAHMSLEGDLSKLRWNVRIDPHPRASALLRRQTIWPKQGYAILPLEAETVPEIKQSVLPLVGLRQRVVHVQIEQQGELVFGAYDEFDSGCVWVAQRVGVELLGRLKNEGSLKSFEPSPYGTTDSVGGMGPEQYLVDLLTEQDVSLDEALRACNGDRQRALMVLSIYVATGSVIVKDGDQTLPDWKAKEILRDPKVFEKYGHLCMTPAPHYPEAREQGQI